jgi:hypothetical protein
LYFPGGIGLSSTTVKAKQLCYATPGDDPKTFKERAYYRVVKTKRRHEEEIDDQYWRVNNFTDWGPNRFVVNFKVP